MQQGNPHFYRIHEVKYTIIECISGNRIAGLDYLVVFDSSQSLPSLP